MGGGCLQESNHRSLPRRGPSTSSLWKIIYCMQFLSYALCSPMLLLKFRIFKAAQCTRRTQRSQNASLKNNSKSLTFRPKKWVVVVAYRRWSFSRGFNCKALTGKVSFFGQAAAYQSAASKTFSPNSHNFPCSQGSRLFYGRQKAAYERWSHMNVRL